MTVSSLADLLASVEPKPASHFRAARQIAELSGEALPQVRLSLLSSFTAEIIQPYLVVEGARRGIALRSNYCPFNQIEVQAFDSSSQLYASRPDVIVIALRLEETSPDLMLRYVALSEEQIEAELTQLDERLETLVEQIRRRTDAAILLFNFALPERWDAGLADHALAKPQTLTLARANATVAAVCRRHTDAHVFDLNRLVADVGRDNAYDPRLFWSARIPFSFVGQLAVAQQLARYARALSLPPCKCLVVDLDNTLWGGVLGEDGTHGISLGEDYPGNVFKQFQRRLISLRDQGVLLAIASKNNRDDVVEAFNRHPDMLLQLSDFSATQIHWDDKVASLRAIAAELNLGLDSLAFFDDSPAERELVQQALPEVTVIDVPTDPIRYVEALEKSGAFDRLRISSDDRRRAEMMAESRQREQSRQQAGSIEAFLQSLQMHATIGQATADTLPRIEQLLSKTNQFNLTTRRHSAAKLESFIEDLDAIILWMRLRDRFGDNGLIGVAVAVPEDYPQWRIDTLLLSCRVIGRQAERVLLATLAEAVRERGGERLVGEFVPSAKNGQVAELYPELGFKPTEDCETTWTLDLTANEIESPEFISLERVGELSEADSGS